jgi:hypothetical protein
MHTFTPCHELVTPRHGSRVFRANLAEIGRKTEKTESWSWKRPESKELSNDILGRVYRGQLLVQKIFDPSRTDMDGTTAEMIAKTRYTNFNR